MPNNNIHNQVGFNESQVKNNYNKAMMNYKNKRSILLSTLGRQSEQSQLEVMKVLTEEFQQNLNVEAEKLNYEKVYKEIQELILNCFDENGGLKANIPLMLSQRSKSESLTRREKESLKDYFLEWANSNEAYREVINKLTDENKKLTSSIFLSYFANNLVAAMKKDGIRKIKEKQKSIATLMGYRQEDATYSLLINLVDLLPGFNFSSLGNFQSHIDILGTTLNTKSLGANVMKNLLYELDKTSNLNGVQIEGIEHPFSSNDLFLGIQSKPWDLNHPGFNMTLGSNIGLFNEWKTLNLLNISPAETGESSYYWHNAVTFISSNLNRAIGENTLAYVVSKEILWTDMLLERLIGKNMFFSFGRNNKNQYIGKIVINQHICSK